VTRKSKSILESQPVCVGNADCKQSRPQSAEKHCGPKFVLITEMQDRHNSDSGVPWRHRGLGILYIPRSRPACSIELFTAPKIWKSHSQCHKSALSHDNIGLSRVGSVAFR
jgi:hypothetical protein